MSSPTIFLDLDGVMTEWILSAAKLFGFSEEMLLESWTPGIFEIEKVLGVGSAELWGKINNIGEDFWADLPETPWARELMDHCVEQAPTFFLTAPSLDPCSLSGKLKWMQRFRGSWKFRDYVMTPNKDLCANPGAILVDDNDRVTSQFEKAGGRAILFPRFWNKEHKTWYRYGANRILDHVLPEIDRAIKNA